MSWVRFLARSQPTEKAGATGWARTLLSMDQTRWLSRENMNRTVWVMMACLICAEPAYAGFSQQEADTLTLTLILPLVAGSLVTDVGIASSLLSSGSVKRGWAVTGTVLGGINSLFAISLLRGLSLDPPSQDRATRQALLIAYTAFAVGSTAFSIYSLFRPPAPAREENDPRAEWRLSLLSSTPEGLLTPGLHVAGRW
jgi:hypothetical protein